MKAYLFGLLMAASALFFQTTTLIFVSSPVVKPDIVLIIVIWAATRFGFNEGILFSFSAGLLTDSLSGAPTGLFAFLYCVFFLACRYLDATTDLETHGARFVVTFVMCILEGISVLASRYMAGPFGVGMALALSVLAKAVFTGLLAAMFMPLLDRLWVERSRLSGFHR